MVVDGLNRGVGSDGCVPYQVLTCLPDGGNAQIIGLEFFLGPVLNFAATEPSPEEMLHGRRWSRLDGDISVVLRYLDVLTA